MLKDRRVRLAGTFILIGAVSFIWLAVSGAEVEIRVPDGTTASGVAVLLQEQGVLRWTTGFRVWAKLSGLDRKLKSGIYHMRKNMSSPEVVWKLYQGGAADYVKVTLPEGWRLEQMAERLEEAGVVTNRKAFIDFAISQQWEGFLFPTTYHLSKAMDASAVARLMREEFDRQVLPEYHKSGRSLDLDKVVTLASIIEREAVLDREKPIIASVYFNRFAHNLKLEADPTVQYALGHWKKGLTLKDLKVDSPYNTYQHTGMPPAPICSPGLESVKAVLYPARTEYVYFMADYHGGHTFVKDYKDFLKVKAAAKEELKRQKMDLKRKKTGPRPPTPSP